MPTITQVIPVPLSGLGASIDVSAMVGSKTVILTGRFRGAYVLYGSHVGGSFAPLFQFDAGGVEGIRHTFNGSLARVAIKSLAEDAVGVTASISGESVPGNNTFAVLGTLSQGVSGPQSSYDLGTTNYQEDLNFIVAGGLEGKLVVEGSSDGVRWNPIGQFSVDPSGPSLLSFSSLPELAPLETESLVRYVRLNVLGRVVGSLTVTVGGSKSGSGGTSSETLAQTYQAGSSATDQTLVLADSKGGDVVFDAQGVGFTSDYVVSVLTSPSGDVGTAFYRTGGMVLGPDNLLIDLYDCEASMINASGCLCIGGDNEVSGNANVVIGTFCHVNFMAPNDNYQSTAVGYSVSVQGINSQGVGSLLAVTGDHSIGLGSNGTVVGANSVLLAVGDTGATSKLYGGQGVVIGHASSIGGVGSPANGAIACGNGVVVNGGCHDSIGVGSGALVQGGVKTIVIGASAGSSAASLSAMAIGAGAYVSNVYSMAFGTESQTTADNQVVFGQSGGVTPGLFAVHAFVVRGYNGAAMDTLNVIDNPADSGDPNIGITGLTVVYRQSLFVGNKTLKATEIGTLPAGALVAYFDGAPA